MAATALMLSSILATSGEAIAIIVIATFFCDGEQPRVHELGQMLTCGWTRNARERCQFAAGQGLATHKSSENCRSRGVSDQRRHFNHVCSSGHAAFYRARRTFSKHQSSVRTEPKVRQRQYRRSFARIVAGRRRADSN